MPVNAPTFRTWPKPGEVYYPESDGKPMAENTEQFKWIVLLVENLKALFAEDPNVFVAGDLLWYPVEGRVDIAFAPDAMVAFGRPMGYRGCYKQWEEGGIAPQVVFEVLSPNNTALELLDKFNAYTRYGIEEYYVYDPEKHELRAWLRRGEALEPVTHLEGYQSPRLKVRFWPSTEGLKVERPDGTAFETHTELLKRAEQERQRAEQERQRAAQAGQRAEQERQRAEAADTRAARLAEKLRRLGVDPDRE
ncbi:MAG: Uma2 family endonuclease [Verrucomicrobia bacterium]|nr:Uma2 family endonuclease [Verrucomicrobiota bacterium]